MISILIIIFIGILLLRALFKSNHIYQSSDNIFKKMVEHRSKTTPKKESISPENNALMNKNTLSDKKMSDCDASQSTQKNKQKKRNNMEILHYGPSADMVEFLKDYDTIEELAQDADNIVFGTVKEKNSYMDEGGDTVYTNYSIELKKVYKGKSKEKLKEKENIHIIDLGGCVKAAEYFAKQDDPKLKKVKEKIRQNPDTIYVQYNFGSDWQPEIGNQYLWFLITDSSDNQTYTPLNSWQGVYCLINDKKEQYFQRYTAPDYTDTSAQITLTNMEKKLK